MHPEILDNKQVELLPYLKLFKRTFYLVGGTAIAWHLGHRRSIDFDLFCSAKLNKQRIRNKLLEIPFQQAVLHVDYDQMHFSINGVKITFFNFPYTIQHPIKINDDISIPNLLTLAAMKAFALGRRAKWKDYVDLYFILKNNHDIESISAEATNIFGNQFSEKLFREQLSFHKDIDYSEPVEYIKNDIPEKAIQDFLTEKATDFL